jgi:hypothetical protein
MTSDLLDCVLEIIEWKNTSRKCECRPKHIKERQQQDGNEYTQMSRQGCGHVHYIRGRCLKRDRYLINQEGE